MDETDRPLARQRRLIDALARKLALAGQAAQVFETHISWVLVTETRAYKFKKALRFDFLDFSTLAARRYYCQEELRLNRRLAPELYLGVVAVGGSVDDPVIDSDLAPLEYAVQMHAFAQEALWESRLREGRLMPAEIDALAGLLCVFHRAAPAAPAASPWGTVQNLGAIADANLSAVAALSAPMGLSDQVDALRSWENAQRTQLAPVFQARREAERIREGHGDLHAGNILTLGDRVQAFDCIEFNDAMRWIDVANDLAFTCMDLQFRARPDLANRLLNRYLELDGDYGALAVFRYYLVHRALVRCKVAWLQARQSGDERCAEQGRRYLELARRSTCPPPPALILMHGFSGSGKSTLAAMLAELSGAIRIRSDVERKRLHPEAAGAGLYTPPVTERTYAHLGDLACTILQAGYPVIVDATFLEARRRGQFRTLARQRGVPFFIVDVRASTDTMRARLTERARKGGDPSDADVAVLSHQLAGHDPLSGEEAAAVLAVDFDAGLSSAQLQLVCRRLLEVL